MLIVLPSPGDTRKASAWLTEQAIAHEIIAIPDSLNYRTGSDIALVLTATNKDDNMDVPMKLSRERFVVMRVFRDFDWPPLQGVAL